MIAALKTAAPSFPNPKDTQEPTNASLWADVLEVARGKRAYLTIGKRTINAPNKGRGFYPWPHPKGIAWAVKQYNGFGGNWRSRQAATLVKMGQGAVLITVAGTKDHARMLKLKKRGLVIARTAPPRHYWDLTPKGVGIAAAIVKMTRSRSWPS